MGMSKMSHDLLKSC
jgi:hypothetical protein